MTKTIAIIIIVVSVLIIATLTLIGCRGKLAPSGSGSGNNNSASAKAEYRKISAKDARTKMNASSNYRILDVRAESEYREMRIEGAYLLPVDEIAKRAESELANKDELIFVYCRSGNRSATAAKELVKLGYTQVYDMGGINSWPYETTKG